jgi:hypothetical protein
VREGYIPNEDRVVLFAMVIIRWNLKTLGLFLNGMIDPDTWMLVVRTLVLASITFPFEKVGI